MNLHAPPIVRLATLGLVLTACGTSDVDVIVRVDDAVTTPAAPPPEPPAPGPTGSGEGIGAPVDAGDSPGSDSEPTMEAGAAATVPPVPNQVPGTPNPTVPAPTTMPTEPAPTAELPDAGLVPPPLVQPRACDPAVGDVPSELFHFYLRDSDRCLDLDVYNPVFIAGIRTFYLRAGNEYCSTEEGSLWHLLASHDDSFEVRNSWVNFNLEIEGAGQAPGDRAVLFPYHELDHQRFQIRDRGDGHAALVPLHAPDLCLGVNIYDSVVLAECTPGDPSQEWDIVSEGCPPPPPPPSGAGAESPP